MELIHQYFPDLNTTQINLFSQLLPLYQHWNNQINVISRKDMDQFYTNHVLHSLGIAKVIQFQPGTKIADFGTGGGFPGIPLSILFPDCEFVLVDSIAKKIKVVNEIRNELKLNNVRAIRGRAEEIEEVSDFIVSRAVTALPAFIHLTKNKIAKQHRNSLHNGILYLKGGDFDDELKALRWKNRVFNLNSFFCENYFETKKLVHLHQ